MSVFETLLDAFLLTDAILVIWLGIRGLFKYFRERGNDETT